MPAETYDYVIVGAGSAGRGARRAAVSEDPGTTVLLLEAGGEADADEVMIPAAFASLFKTRWDWNYSTTEQKQLHSRRAYWPRMKALGGCSSMNAMIYIRGNRADYDAWRDQYGADGWGFDDVLPYFVKAEGNTRLGAPLHGQDGPLHVEDRRLHPPAEPRVRGQRGQRRPQADRRLQRRRAGGRRALPGHLPQGPALVDQRGLPQARPRARQPHRRDRRPRDAGRARGSSRADRRDLPPGRRRAHRRDATREVLLCGGAINSPQLLLLSGIGPGSHLARGRRRDQGGPRRGRRRTCRTTPWCRCSGTPTASPTSPSSTTSATSRAGRRAAPARWPPTSARPAAFFASRDGLPAPDMQFHMAPAGFYDNGLHEPTTRWSPPRRRWSRSRAVATCGCARPTRPGTRRSRRRTSTTRPTSTRCSPGCGGPSRSAPRARSRRYLDRPWQLPADPTDDDLVEHARNWGQTLYHPTSTCAMGSGEDAVVDPELRVRGVDGLRVVDASVMPAVPRGNTNAPTIMIAEKAADLIRSAR